MQLTEKKYEGWSGVNNSDDQMNVKPTEMTDAANVLFTNFGEFFSRYGLTKLKDLADNVVQLIFYIEEAQILYQTGDGLYLSNEGSADILISTVTTTEPLAYSQCPADGKIYFVSEDDRLFSWDGTTKANATTEIYGNVMFWYQNHMFLGGNAGFTSGTRYENRIFISNLGNPLVWSSDDWLQASGNGVIVGMCELGEHSLVVFKDKSLFYVTGYGLTSWTLTTSNDATYNVDNSVGCAGRNAFGRVGDEVWFVDNKKNVRIIYQTQFDPYRKTYRSEKVMGWLSEVSLTHLPVTKLLYFDDKVFIFYPDSTGERSIVLVFDIIAARKTDVKPDGTMGESWTRFTGDLWSIYGACVAYISGLPTLLTACENALYEYSGTTDDDEPIELLAKTKNDDFGKYSVVKRFKLFFAKGEIAEEADQVEVYASIGNSEESLIGYLAKESSGGILWNDALTEGTFVLDADQSGLDPSVADNTLGASNPVATKLRYDTSSLHCTDRVIKHIFKCSATGAVSVSKVSSNFVVRNIK